MTVAELLAELTTEDLLELDATGWQVGRKGSDLAVRKTEPGGAYEAAFRFLGQRTVRVQTTYVADSGATAFSDAGGTFTREFFWKVLDAAADVRRAMQPPQPGGGTLLYTACSRPMCSASAASG